MSKNPTPALGSFLERTLQKKDTFIDTIDYHLQTLSSRKNEKENQESLSIQVHVKLRPLNKLELNQGHYQSIFCVDQSVTALYYPTFQVLTDAALEVHSNEFDGNHNENTTHDEFFHSSCSSILHIVHNSNGGEGAIFAYGQTGSGKTYTINGVAERLVKDLPYSSSEIHIQLLEIMGDNVKDLLSGNLVKVMINSEGNPTLVGNSVLRQIMDEVECLNTINEGFKLRKTIGTSKNDTSSRSHFICQIQIRHLKTNKISNIKLVDLAGSERHSDSKNHDSERLKEAIYINSSLMALKDCIRNKIHKSKNNDVRIPTRSSKLTTLLKNVLDPVDESNVRLVMIAAMSPSTHDVAHSLDTFRYAAALKPNFKSSANKPVGKVDKEIQNAEVGHASTTRLSKVAPQTKSSLAVRPKSNSSSESVVSTKPSAKSQTDSSPMAWSKSKLNSWIEINSERKVTLDDFIVQRTSDNNDFIPPPWKMLYDLTAEEWKLRSKLTLKQATVLRNSYKSLFLKKRPMVKSSQLNNDYSIEVISLLEKVVLAPKKNRQQEAMEKIAAKGAAAKLKMQQKRAVNR
ncbi:hypothetical protein HDV02_002766 [Globomyces sp. JEL0801]|nr:hypothetical protein HDV02_002766 [Globomyces sp. JEL0801]